MRNKNVLVSVAALALLTLIFALLLRAREPSVQSGEILVDGARVKVSELALRPVEGVTVSGKGEKTEIRAQGIPLSDVCGAGATMTVTAKDNYSATVSTDEKAYLLDNGDGTVQLVVFGDSDLKRNVRNVVRIDGK